MSYQQLRQQQRIDLVSAVPLPMPLSMYIDPCSACNFSCVFCPQSIDNSKEHFSQKMTLEAFEKIVYDIKLLGRLKTCNLFSFGEPLLNSLTPDFLKIAVYNDIAEKYVITSNVSLLTEKKAQSIVNYGLDFLRVSIYGATTKTYQARTNTKITLDTICKNLLTLKKYRDSVKSSLFIAVKMLDTGDESENNAFLDKFTSLGDECFIEPMHNWHNSDELFVYNTCNTNTSKCPYPFYTLVVHADLTVSVCCPDWNKQLVVGNLANETLKEIWNGAKLYDLQCSLLEQNFSDYSVCRTCSFYKINSGDNIDILSLEEYAFRRKAKKAYTIAQ